MRDLARNLLAVAEIPWAKNCGFEDNRPGNNCHNYANPKMEANCCSGCAGQGGYLDHGFMRWTDEHSKWFHPKDGFWAKGIGCILPRELRSDICLFFTCGHWYKDHAFDKDQVMVLHNLNDTLRDIFRKHEVV